MSCLPEEFRKQKNIADLPGHLDFIATANTAEDTDFLTRAIQENPGALDKRFQLAAQQLLFDNYEAALDMLLKLHQQNPEYEEARAKCGMLTIFGVLDDDNELVKSCRRKLLEKC